MRSSPPDTHRHHAVIGERGHAPRPHAASTNKQLYGGAGAAGTGIAANAARATLATGRAAGACLRQLSTFSRRLEATAGASAWARAVMAWKTAPAQKTSCG